MTMRQKCTQNSFFFKFYENTNMCAVVLNEIHKDVLKVSMGITDLPQRNQDLIRPKYTKLIKGLGINTVVPV